MLLVLGGCQWMNPRSSGGDWDLTDAQRDSLDLYFQNYAKLSKENKRLRVEVETQELDLTKLHADHQRQIELNEFLSDELENMKNDLDQVEKQFISFEKRLKVTETKASAVAAVAEVQLLFEKLRKDLPGGLDSTTVAEVKYKLATCDELVRKQNYSASVYYANRAMRILNQTERRMNIALSDGDSRIVAVSRANMRDGPGSKFKVIDGLDYGTVVVQLESKNDWCKVRTNSGKSGWIHNSLIR
jgi:DNA repair exonuclease SbcCD ATPase subunit